MHLTVRRSIFLDSMAGGVGGASGSAFSGDCAFLALILRAVGPVDILLEVELRKLPNWLDFPEMFDSDLELRLEYDSVLEVLSLIVTGGD